MTPSALTNLEWPPPGHYILAVSGGVDSVVLLDVLARAAESRNLELTVAHFNHGWPDSDAHEETVRTAAKGYDVPLEGGRGQVDRTETAARTARYAFLRQVKQKLKADAIITAHHRDDFEETAVMNLLRGTGRRGLTPFVSIEDIRRPFVQVRKRDVLMYAQDHNLTWHHDSSNDDPAFRRNRVRHQLLPQLSDDSARELAELLDEAAGLNTAIDQQLAGLYQVKDRTATADVACVRALDLSVLTELIVMMVYKLRPGTELDRRSVEALAVDLKTSRVQRPRQLTKQLSAQVAHGTFKVVFTP